MSDESSQGTVVHSTPTQPAQILKSPTRKVPVARPNQPDQNQPDQKQPDQKQPGTNKLADTNSKPASQRVMGSFDVMGGIAEYCGSLTLSAPTRDHVDVATTLRQDQQVAVSFVDGTGSPVAKTDPQHPASDSIHQGSTGHSTNSRSSSIANISTEKIVADWPLRAFYGEHDGELASVKAVHKIGAESGTTEAGLVLAVLRSLLADGVIPHFSGGLTIRINSSLLGDVTRRRAALAMGVHRSVTAAFGAECSEADSASLVHGVFGDVGEYPVGLATVTGLLIDKPGHLTPICCRPLEIGEWVALPDGVTLIGIDSGILHPKAAEKYRHARTTSKMGTAIIARLIETANPNQGPWHGHLAGITVSEYVDQFRDLLPTKIKGAQFLERFGQLPDPAAVINAKDTYKIRSRTEHHIYENDRVRKFAEKLSRATRTGQLSAIIEAGELMYASHWSYGQRCGLGSKETDALVNMIRGCGKDSGVYGARISGAGTGGTVVVLMRDSDETRSAIARAIGQYEQKIGLSTTIQPAAHANS